MREGAYLAVAAECEWQAVKSPASLISFGRMETAQHGACVTWDEFVADVRALQPCAVVATGSPD